MTPLAHDLARRLAETYQTALDVGTGTGILAGVLPARIIFGIDTSAAMLRHAIPQNVWYVQGDIQRAPFAAETFDLIAASFGLNATHPRRTLRALWRLLRPGGVVLLQEWGAMDQAVYAVQSVLEAYIPLALEDQFDAYHASFDTWENFFQTSEDYAELFAEYGFVEIEASESAPVIVSADREAFLAYQLVWPSAQAILAAQDDPAPLYANLRAVLPSIVNWQPNLIRLSARKPTTSKTG
jgi:SAM-dependent methyltransferase